MVTIRFRLAFPEPLDPITIQGTGRASRKAARGCLASLRALPSAVIVPSAAIAATIHMMHPAMAGSCTPGPISVCSGAAASTDTMQSVINIAPIEITTTDGFGLSVTDGSYGFNLYSRSGITFADNYLSTITTNGLYGIQAYNETAGNVSIVSTGLVVSTQPHGDGIRVTNEGAGSVVRTHETRGWLNGINIEHRGTGSVDVVSTLSSEGDILQHGAGIRVWTTAGTGITIEAVDSTGGAEGIFARNATTGAASVTSTGLARGRTGSGILIDNLIGSTDAVVNAANTHGGSYGIRVNHYGSGSVEVNSTGTARADNLTGLSTYAATSTTTTTVNAVDTDGGGWGIYAIHLGSGPVAVTSTGTAAGRSADGIVVQTGGGSSGLSLSAHNAQGGQHGISTNHASALGTPDNTAAIVVTGHILGGSGYGIATETVAGVLTNITVQAGAVVESTAGNGISNNDGDSNVVIADGGTVNGRVSLGLGSDTISLRGTLSGITVLDGGGGGTDTLNLTDAASVSHAASNIRNWTAINLDNSNVTLTGGGMMAVGTPGDMTTGIFLSNGSTLDGSQDDFSLDGNMSLAAGTRFIASGAGSGSNTISGNVINAGLISAAGGGAGDRLRITGDYTASNGSIVLETMLGDDTSPTDKLEIGGDTSGTSTVRVMNANGLGAATNEGIEIISVAGLSAGVFTLQGDYQFKNASVVVGGAYAYRLEKGNGSGTETNNWYLKSELMAPEDAGNRSGRPLYQAGVPVYEAYPQALAGLNTLATLQQRVGNRAWMDRGGARESRSVASVSDSGIWARVEGTRNSIEARSATSGKGFDQNIFKAQAGIDAPVFKSATAEVKGGVTAHYSHGATDTHSAYGDGRISTAGYGIGGTLTWYAYDGLYVDGQAQGTWYQSDLSSLLANRALTSGNNAFGYAFSLESGYRSAIGAGWSLTPQAQLTYSNVDFDTFVDAFGAHVRADKGASVQGRLGLALAHEAEWRDAYGRTNRARTYGIANIYNEFLDGSRVDVAATRFSFEQQRVWGGLGVGGTYSWNDDTYALYAESLANTSLADLGSSYSLQGKAGGRVRW